MAKRKTAQQLRDEAKVLLEQASQLENDAYAEIGKIAVKLARGGHVKGELLTEIKKHFDITEKQATE